MIEIENTLNAIIDKAETSVENLLQQYERHTLYSKHNRKEFAQAFERLRRGNLKHFNRLRRDIKL